MSQHVELSTLNPRYEGYRLRDHAREARLLASIAARGIEEPLQGVDPPGGRFLLDGFMRYRCAQKLGIHCVPYVSLGAEEATGIVSLMRVSRDQTLGILEQARFVVDLLTLHGLSVSEVAEMLSRSKAWVSMRTRPAGGDGRHDPADPLPGHVSGVLLHVHAASVQAHELGHALTARTVRAERGRPAAERPRDRAVGSRLLPRPRRLTRGDRGGEGGLDAPAHAACATG